VAIRCSACVVAALILVSIMPFAPTSSVTAFSPHGPIHIASDAEFNSTNGVTGGAGTASDPYIIEEWEFSSSGSLAIWIQYTHAYFVIRNVSIQDNKIELAYCENGRILDSSIRITTSDSISIWSCSNIEVARCTLSLDEYAGAGVRVSGSTNVTIADCHISNSYWGILVYDLSSFVNITGNNIAKCTYNGGIVAYGAQNVFVGNNTLTEAGIGVKGTYQTLSMDGNNTVDGRPVRFFRDRDNLRIDGVHVGQLIAVNCQGLRASNLSFSNVYDGIYMAISTGARIENCTFSSVGNVGIDLEYCTDVSLFRNDLSNFEVYGVRLEYCTEIVATYNTLARTDSSHHGQGIILYHSSSAWIQANRFTNILDGVMAWDCRDLDIWHNAMTGVYWSGVQLAGSQDVRVTENLVTLCSLQSWGIDAALEITRSSRITLVNNSMINNTYQVLMSESTSLSWNGTYAEGGNYWSNYTGPDTMSGPAQNLTGGDGIGDVPYDIDPSNTDWYPLIASRIKNLAPMAFMSVQPMAGNTTTTFDVDSNGSWDFEDSSGGLQFRWDWEGDGTWDTDWGTNITWNHTYAQAGNFTMRLEVMDSGGLTSNYSVAINVTGPQNEIVPQDNGIDPVVVVAIVGVVVASVAFLVALFLLRRRKNPKAPKSP
jgi:parallel beta-helix repeat protein